MMSKKKSVPRQLRKAQITRDKLLQAARMVFTERGLDMTRIDDITERADLGKGTFYNHFKNKDDLIKQLFKEIMSELCSDIRDRCSGFKNLPSLIDAIITVHIDFFSRRWEDYVLYFQGRADLHLQQSYSGIETPFITYLETIEDLISSLILTRPSKAILRRIGCAVAGFVSGYYSFAIIASEDEDVDKTLSSLRDALVSSLVRFINDALL